MASNAPMTLKDLRAKACRMGIDNARKDMQSKTELQQAIATVEEHGSVESLVTIRKDHSAPFSIYLSCIDMQVHSTCTWNQFQQLVKRFDAKMLLARQKTKDGKPMDVKHAWAKFKELLAMVDFPSPDAGDVPDCDDATALAMDAIAKDATRILEDFKQRAGDQSCRSSIMSFDTTDDIDIEFHLAIYPRICDELDKVAPPSAARIVRRNLTWRGRDDGGQAEELPTAFAGKQALNLLKPYSVGDMNVHSQYVHWANTLKQRFTCVVKKLAEE